LDLVTPVIVPVSVLLYWYNTSFYKSLPLSSVRKTELISPEIESLNIAAAERVSSYKELISVSNPSVFKVTLFSIVFIAVNSVLIIFFGWVIVSFNNLFTAPEYRLGKSIP